MENKTKKPIQAKNNKPVLKNNNLKNKNLVQKTNLSKTVTKTNNSRLFLVGMIVLVIIVLLVMLLPGLNKNIKDIKNIKEKTFVCPDGTVVSLEKNCPIPEIPLTQKEKYELCANKTLIQEKDECLQKLAIESNNAALCDNLINLDSEKCKRLVWKEYAVVSQELSNCSKLITKFDQSSCIKEIALNASNSSICNTLPELIKQNSCLIELAAQDKNLEICSLINGSATETCKFNTVLVIGNADLCDLFSLPSIKYDCITRIAEKNNNISLCNKIFDSLLKKRCINNLS